MAGRTVGSTNSFKSTRNQSTAQRRQQNKKCQETKKRNKDIKRRKNKANFMKSLFGQGGQQSTATTEDNINNNINDTVGDGPDTEHDETNGDNNDDTTATETAGGDTIAIVNNHTMPTIVNPSDIEPNLEYDEEAAAKKGSDDALCGKQSGIQQKYVEAIQNRVKIEVSKDFNGTNQWLVNHLKRHEWWIRKDKAPTIIKLLNNSDENLNLKREYQAYYRDVFVWLPDVRWPDEVKRAYVPCCPNCKTNKRVGPHCFRELYVVQNAATCKLEELADKLLDIKMDKTLQKSEDWSKPTDDQLKYAVIDGAVSLEVYEKLEDMPDLTCRLTIADIHPGKKVDLVPRNGDVSCMATRAATVVVADMLPCQCPRGTVPKNGRGQKMIRAGVGSCVVEIKTIHSPGFHIPGYEMEDTGDAVTLGDIGKQTIVVPFTMLREHDYSNSTRATPTDDTAESSGITKPASEKVTPRRTPSGRHKLPLSDEFDYSVGRSNRAVEKEIIEFMDDESDFQVYDVDEQEGEFVGMNDCSIDDDTLTKECISMLYASIFQSAEAQSGKTPLQCKGLSEAPKPGDIVDRFSVVLGDIFHAMNRTKVPVKHEAKKAFLHALMNAFLVWNEEKMKKLEDKMREDGMSDEDIKAKRYFNSHLYRGCVERHAPSPKILYWRVRAVYVLFGNMIDSSSGKPLFNEAAWKKADNVLKEILCGFYSDPPGFNFYNKRLKPNGEVMKNKYDMEMIECLRGTNRTEAYHKNLLTTFGTWHTGVEMSDYLLAERRHRHNHNVSEKRRFGFPKIGHYDTWKIDQLQILHLDNHGIQLYQYWTNASDYKNTDESFDTVALHHAELHEAMEKRYETLGDIKLTGDALYICTKMGTRYPFLPFSGEDENKQYAKYELQKTGPVDEIQAAVDWCQFIDGKTIHAKLPSHMRVHATNVDRSQRVRECVRKAKGGLEMINELNKKISPVVPEVPAAQILVNIDPPATGGTDTSQVHPPVNWVAPPAPRQNVPTDKTTNLVTQHVWRDPRLPPTFPRPRALAYHGMESTIVGGFSIGAATAPTPSTKRQKHCKRCTKFRGPNAAMCKGRGGEKYCIYFQSTGDIKPPPATSATCNKTTSTL